MILYEMLLERLPYWDSPNVMNIQIRVANDPQFRPTVPPEYLGSEDSHQEYVQIMTQCWDHDAAKRPDLPQVIARLQMLAQKLPKPQANLLV